MKRRIIANPEPCTGCLNCVMVCAQEKSGSANPQCAGIRVHLDPFNGTHKITVCHQCKDPKCAEACPRDAIVRNTDTGAMVFDYSKCIACGICVRACPFQSMFWNDTLNLPVKCDLCNGDPQCLHACHFGVLQYAAKNSDVTMGIPETDQDPALGRE